MATPSQFQATPQLITPPQILIPIPFGTPTEWKSQFQVNTGAAANGGQSDPQIIGLSNGNVLVAWEESAAGSIGTPAGTDIIGKIYDAEGNVVRDSYRINTTRYADDEGDFDIAATNDGGFVIAYVDDDISAADTDIIWQRHNSAGNTIDSATVKNGTGTTLSNPQIAVDLTDNTSVITYTDTSGGDPDIFGRSVSATGTIGSEFDAAQNSSNDDDQGDLAILSDGNYVQVYREEDPTAVGIEFEIFQADGTTIRSAREVTNTGEDPQVTSLTNGNFVVTWEDSGDIKYRIYDPTGNTVTGILTATSAAGNQNEAEVVALQDGDFVIVWDDDTAPLNTQARRFNANGTADGFTFTVDTGNSTTPNVGVTGDGRILFTWKEFGNIHSSIWDPRSSTINASDYDINRTNFVRSTVITSKVTSSTVNGDGSSERILGQGGNDTLNGAGGNDTILGRAGNDVINGGSGTDTIDGGLGNDTIQGGFSTDTINAGFGNDVIIINNGENIDNVNGGVGIDHLDLSDITSASGAANVNLLTGVFQGLGPNTSITNVENVTGTQEDDALTGNNLANELNGQAGNDTISGEGGNDTIVGGAGLDSILGGIGNDSMLGGQDNDTIKGGSGNDTLNGGQGADILKGQDDNDLLLGFGNNDNLNGGSGNDTLWGGGGNDFLAGITGRDILNGSVGNDTLNGGDDRDTLIGSRGNDFLVGGNGLDVLNGADNVAFGVGERDTLEGGLGTQDRFKLGDTASSYYLDAGAGGTSFARIVDFESIDRIMLSGSSSDYRLSQNGGDTFILRREAGPDDTVGRIENTVGLNLSGPQFIYL